MDTMTVGSARLQGIGGFVVVVSPGVRIESLAMRDDVLRWLADPWVQGGLAIPASFVLAWVVASLLRLIRKLVGRTRTRLDDKLLDVLHGPLVTSTALLGMGVAVKLLPLPKGLERVSIATLESVAIVALAQGAFRAVSEVLGHLSLHAREHAVVQARTLPFFDMAGKALVVGAAIYFGFLAWNIDVTAWIASAGIVGLAVGFAAKDTLANLFSGIFIVADGPYRLGDYIVLDGGLRGRVTSIGIRSTRILTKDDIEITIPNAIIANSKIVNEAGGPSVRQRVGVEVEAAYGSDIDEVHRVLRSAAEGVPHVLEAPAPQVHFLAFGASGLRHVLYVWILEPDHKELVVHELNTRIYKAFAAAGIEIPYSKHDVYIKEFPVEASSADGETQGSPRPGTRPPSAR